METEPKSDPCAHFEKGPTPPKACGWAVGNELDGTAWIFHTTDGGASWEPQALPAGLERVNLEAVCAVDADHAWIVGDKRPDVACATILYWKNDGQGWRAMGSPLDVPNTSLTKVRAIDRRTIWMVGGCADIPGDNRTARGTILVTRDEGVSWSMQTSDEIPQVLLQGLSVVNEKVVWVSGYQDDGFGTILQTRDGGGSWNRLGSKKVLPNKRYIGLSALSDQVAWAVGNGFSIRYTDDGGTTWTEQSKWFAPEGYFDANEVQILGDRSGWVAEDEGAIWHLADGVWAEQSNGASGYYLRSVSAIDSRHAWVVGNSDDPTADGGPANAKAVGKVLFTADGGAHWHCQQFRGAYEFPAGLIGVSFVGPA